MAERWRQLVLGTKTDHTRDNFLWNMIGSALYALATIVLVRITRGTAGTGVGADFNIALKTGQILLTIGYFEIRPFQVTDVAGEYSFQEYYSFRFLTCGAMAVSGVRFALFALLCLYKLMDGAADVYEGEFQKQGRMDLAGKSVAFRTLLSVGAYGAAAAVTGNVALSVCVMVLAAALGVLLFDVALIGAFERPGFCFSRERLGRLMGSTGLLFVGSILCLYIFNASAYAVDTVYQGTDAASEDIRYIYACLFMPTSVIYLACGFVFKPILTTLAGYFAEGKRREFARLTVRLLGAAVLITAACLAGGALLGIPVLSAVYGYDLRGYLRELEILILGGGFNAASLILYYALTVMRRQRVILTLYGIVTAATLAVSMAAVRRWGLMGAAGSYCGLMALQTALFAGAAVWCYRKAGRDGNERVRTGGKEKMAAGGKPE